MDIPTSSSSAPPSIVGWRPIAMFLVAALFYLYEFVLRVAPSAMFTDLMAEFSADAEQLGKLASFYFISYAVLQLPGGALLDRFGPRRLLTFAVMLCAISTFMFGFTQQLWVAYVARLFIGAGSAFAFISCVKIITLWFPSRLFSTLAGLTLAIGMLGGVAGQVPVSFALHYMSWRTLFFALGILGLLLGVTIWILVQDREQTEKSWEEKLGFWSCLKVVISQPANWAIALYAFLSTAPSDALGGLWGVAYLEQVHGMDRMTAATATTMTFVGMAVGSPLIGIISDAWRSRRLPMMLGGLAATASLVALIYLPHLTFLMAATLFFSFGFFGTYILAFVVAKEMNPPQYVGTTAGFVNALSNFGSSLLQYGIGYSLVKVSVDPPMIDGHPVYSATDYQTSLSSVPLFYFLAVVLVFFVIRETFNRKSD